LGTFVWLIGCFATTLLAQERPSVDYRQQALKWIDTFSTQQVLFHRDDMARVRKEIEAANDAEAKQWWEETAEVRAALDGPKWKETQRWLKEFLKVQAIYSDEQIAQFRDEASSAVKTSPAEFLALLDSIEAERQRLISGAASSARLRDQQLAIVSAYRRENVQQRDAARFATERTGTIAPRTVVRRDVYGAPPPPLVNSIDAVRWTLMGRLWRQL
jgi:hypothetical protein